MNETSSTAVLADRLTRASQAMGRNGIDVLIATPGAELEYLVAISGESHERLTCLILPAASNHGTPALVVSRVEAPGWNTKHLGDLGVEVLTWLDHEDPYLLVRAAAGEPKTFGILDSMPTGNMLAIRKVLPKAEPVLVSGLLERLRTAAER